MGRKQQYFLCHETKSLSKRPEHGYKRETLGMKLTSNTNQRHKGQLY